MIIYGMFDVIWPFWIVIGLVTAFIVIQIARWGNRTSIRTDKPSILLLLLFIVLVGPIGTIVLIIYCSVFYFNIILSCITIFLTKDRDGELWGALMIVLLSAFFMTLLLAYIVDWSN